MKPSTPIRQLRQTLVQARQAGDARLLAEVEDGLRRLADEGYRCCLLDYERREATYYVRLVGYHKGRLKAELEFPINPRLKDVQLLPLSHLADYDEVEKGPRIEGIFRDVAPFIHHKKALLELLPPPTLLPDPNRPKRPRRQRRRGLREKKVWWYVGGVFLLMVLAHLIVARLGPHELL
jgi:hypothetical protein